MSIIFRTVAIIELVNLNLDANLSTSARSDGDPRRGGTGLAVAQLLAGHEPNGVDIGRDERKDVVVLGIVVDDLERKDVSVSDIIVVGREGAGDGLHGALAALGGVEHALKGHPSRLAGHAHVAGWQADLGLGSGRHFSSRGRARARSVTRVTQ